MFTLIRKFNSSYDICWYYNERHHGKGPIDDIGGTVKNLVFRHFKPGKVVINTPEEFAHYADKFCEGVNSLYLPKRKFWRNQVIQRQHLELKKQPGVRMIILTSDENPILKQHYRKATDPEICGHNDGAVNDIMCAHCFEIYVNDGSEWLKCPLCRQWFHERCFELWGDCFIRKFILCSISSSFISSISLFLFYFLFINNYVGRTSNWKLQTSNCENLYFHLFYRLISWEQRMFYWRKVYFFLTWKLREFMSEGQNIFFFTLQGLCR